MEERLRKSRFSVVQSYVQESEDPSDSRVAVASTCDQIGADETLQFHTRLEQLDHAVILTNLEDPEQRAKVVGRLSAVCKLEFSHGRFERSLDDCWHTLEYSMDTYGTRHPIVADKWQDLGLVLQRVQRLQDALDAHAMALQIRQEYFGGTHETVSLSLNHIAVTCFDMAEEERRFPWYCENTLLHGPKSSQLFDKALELLTTAMEIRKSLSSALWAVEAILLLEKEQLQPNENFDVLKDALSELIPRHLEGTSISFVVPHQSPRGVVVMARYTSKSAADCDVLLNQLTAEHIKHFCADPRTLDNLSVSSLRKQKLNTALETASVQHNLAVLHLARGDPDSALKSCVAALNSRVAELGRNHRDSVTSHITLGSVLQSLGRWKDALKTFQQGLNLRMQQNGEHHALTAVVHDRLGSLLQEQGNFELSLTHFEKALMIRNFVFGPTHRETILSFGNVGTTLMLMNRTEDALPIIEHALAECEREFGEFNKLTTAVMCNFGLLYENQQHFDKALRLHMRAVEARASHLGVNHPLTAAALQNAGSCLMSLSKHEEALEYLTTASTVLKEKLGQGHPHYGIAISNVALCLRLMGRVHQALPFYERALGIFEICYGKSHTHVLTTLANIVKSMILLGWYLDALGNLDRLVIEWEAIEGATSSRVAEYKRWRAACLAEIKADRAAFEKSSGSAPRSITRHRGQV